MHDLIDHAGEDKVMAVYTLLSADTGTGVFYDEHTLNMLEATRDEMLSGKVRTLTLEETIKNIRKHRKI
ncbi:MAG: hypothetical protein V4649_06100 [Bacteroidota bacterium]